MLIHIRKLFLRGVLGVALFSGMMVTPVSAYSPYTTTSNGVYSSLASKDALIQSLLAQVRLLQAELLKIQTATMETFDSVNEEPEILPSEVTKADYTRGDINSLIQIVTYTDFDCPFCKMFHSTLNSLSKKYPDVAITYRHFPIEQLHPRAKELAIAAECVGSIKGDAAFWKFTDALFASRDIQSTTDMRKIPSLALQAGVSSSALSLCRKSEEARSAVEEDMHEGTQSGVQGTPMSFVFFDGEVGKISGAQPLSKLEDGVNELLQ